MDEAKKSGRGSTSALGQMRTIRACPLHVCFTPKLGPYGAPAELSEKGHYRSSRIACSGATNGGTWRQESKVQIEIEAHRRGRY